MGVTNNKLGEHLHERLVKEFLPFSCVADIMCQGLYQSFAIPLNKTTGGKFNPDVQLEAGETVDSKLLERGVIARTEHGKRVGITPALVITQDELDAGLDILLSVVKELKPV